MTERIGIKDEEIRRLQLALMAKAALAPMFPRTPAPKESLTESTHAPKTAKPSRPEPVVIETRKTR